jgi:hypothetical protein
MARVCGMRVSRLLSECLSVWSGGLCVWPVCVAGWLGVAYFVMTLFGAGVCGGSYFVMTK